MVELLAVGYSVRSLARSALAAGVRVATIDGFGDRDLLERAPHPSSHRTHSPFDVHGLPGIAPAARHLAWTSNLENHPDILEKLCRERTVIGNGPDVLRRVRRAEEVESVLDAARLPAAATAMAGAATAQEAWVVKPRASGGGHGVRRWEPGTVPAPDEYLQAMIDGVPGSLLFLADGHEVSPVGMTCQLVGDAAFGVRGFAWCGNMTGPGVLPREHEVHASAVAAARALTRAFRLRGMNGIDFIARDGEAVVVEVNPRWTASVELFERASGMELFSAHAAAAAGALPAPHEQVTQVLGKAVVFAPRTWTVPDTDAWLSRGDVADVPRTGVTIPSGAPICTVFASGPTPVACRERLVEHARAVLQ